MSEFWLHFSDMPRQPDDVRSPGKADLPVEHPENDGPLDTVAADVTPRMAAKTGPL